MDTKSCHNSNKHNHRHDHNEHHKMMVKDFKKRFIISSIITIPVLVLSPLIQKLLGYSINFNGSIYILFLLSSIIFFRAGWPFLKGMVTETKQRNPGMMTLIALAISVAYIYSAAVTFGLDANPFFWELATLIDIMLLGHRIEMKSVLSASKALEKLSELIPDYAHIIKNNKISDIKINKLAKKDIILVKTGEKIPADGVVIKGTSYVDESMLTGESKAVKKSKNSKVIGGSLNIGNIIEIEVTGTGEDAYLSKVIKLVKEAQANKSKTEKLADVAAKRLTFIAITAGLGTFIYRYFYGPNLAFAIERLATVMVIACPHALGLAIPLVNSVSTSKSAKNGLLIRNRTAFERTRKLTTIVFDKTGTLTEGNFSLNDIIIFDKKYNKTLLLQIANSLEQNSEHPIGKAIINKAKKENIETLKISNFNLIKGEGIEAKRGEKHIELLSQKAINKKGIKTPDTEDFDKLSTLVFILIDNKIVGLLTLKDKIRKESFLAIKKIQEQGIKCIMLTGDNKQTAKQVSNELKLDGYFAEVLPHEKQEKIKNIQKQNEFVAMVGDGINDAPALALADVGIAIGSGTDIAAETADIILINSNPEDIVSLIAFGKATYNKMLQNLFWATGYNAFAIPLAAGLLMGVGITISPAVGAALMSISTVVVAINAKLLKFKKIK